MKQLYDPFRRRSLRRLAGHALGAALAPWAAGCGGTAAAPETIDEVALLDGDPQPVLQVRVHGHTLHLVLDSGADATVLDAAAAQRLGLVLSADPVAGSGGTGPNPEMRRARLDRLSIGRAECVDMPVYVMAFPREFTWDGVLGTDVLRRWAMGVDVERGRVALSPAGRLPAPDGATRVPLQLLPGGKLLAQARVDGIAGAVTVDSGAGNVLTLFTPAVERGGLRQRWSPAVRMVTGITTGGVSQADLVRAGQLELGGHVLQRPVIELSHATAGLFASTLALGNLGCEALRRFTWAIDVATASLWLRPNVHVGEPFHGPLSGLAFRDTDAGLQVVDVVAGGPADQAGLRVGDRIDALAGLPLGPGRAGLLRSALRAIPGTAVPLATARGEHVVVLRELV